MIRHIVLFSARQSSDIPTIKQALEMLREIPHAALLEVSENMKSDSLSSEIDIVVYGEFDDEKALDNYKQHELYQEAIKVVRPIRDIRIAVDIEASA